MLSSNSTWDRKSSKKPLSPAFVKGAGRVVYEFENRRSEKIFAHTLGRIEFRPGLGDALSSGRNEQIDNFYDDIRYKSVAHVFIKPNLSLPVPQVFQQDVFETGVFYGGSSGTSIFIVGHGVPLKTGMENCALIGAKCQTTGSDTECERGKCEIGVLGRVSKGRWRYDSLTVPGLYYFVFGTESVTLRSISRGRFALPAGAGMIDVSRVASVPATVYLPPDTYSVETFTRRVITSRYAGSDAIRSLTDSVDNFIRSLLNLNQATVEVEEEVRDRLLVALKSVLDPVWYGFVDEAIGEIWQDRFTGNGMTNRQFLVDAYETLTTLYKSGIEVMMSGVKASRVSVDDRIGRPVYGRLPGIEGAYNNLDVEDSPAKWLTAGADDLLSGTKHILDTFYRTYLDPETCYPLNLDWIAQHLGFVGGLWNLEWSNSTKRLLLRNAHVNAVSGSIWTRDPELDTLRRIDTGRIEGIKVNPRVEPKIQVYEFGIFETGVFEQPDTVIPVAIPGSIETVYRYSGKLYNTSTNLTTVETFNNLVVDVSRWQGIFPSRGSLLTVLFMFWALGVKAHSPEELKYDLDTDIFTVRSGLRDQEINAPVNLPYMVDVLRVGTDTDAEVENYPNQLIAGIGTCQDELSANTTVIRMPFYYNRNGRTWDATVSVMANYAPSTSINRVQYAYAVADLLVADDVFFEPEVVTS